ncbi:hypothetical protein ATO11_15550 [Pseudaestuariivita atlantica]|uniref:Uncharacterized protein n=2 Tax=Pseudaestuariivita atlantica TaxID=1317121 RepID=A0A0L1JM87_9RHOB|nr:hypothetical protein ATO11_15550 [Pseudaestuariivita atlantica]
MATLVAGLGGQAAAEGWAVADLGPTPDMEQCMVNAKRVFARFSLFNTFEVGDRTDDEWIVYQWDMNEAGDDAIIVCLETDGAPHAFLSIFSNDRAPAEIRDRLSEDFKTYRY